MNENRIDRLAARLLPHNEGLLKDMAQKLARAYEQGDCRDMEMWRAVFTRALAMLPKEAESMEQWHFAQTLAMEKHGPWFDVLVWPSHEESGLPDAFEP